MQFIGELKRGAISCLPKDKIKYKQEAVTTACSRGFKGPCKRTQHCWPTTPNIVGPNNVVTCCVRVHGTTTMLALFAYSLKPVKLLGPCKRTQHCWPTTPNNVGSCWHLLRPFAWALTFLRSFVAGKANFHSQLHVSLVHFAIVKSQAILIIRLGVAEVISAVTLYLLPASKRRNFYLVGYVQAL